MKRHIVAPLPLEFKNPRSLTAMLMGRIFLAIISQKARVSFLALSEDGGKGDTHHDVFLRRGGLL